MKEDLDDILTDWFDKKPFNEEEERLFEEWRHASESNEELGKTARRLKQRRKVLAAHQSKEAVFEKIRHQVKRRRMRRRIAIAMSCAAAVALLIGSYFILSMESGKTVSLPCSTLLAPQHPVAELILPNGEKRTWGTKEEIVILSDTNKEMRTSDQTLIVENHNTVEEEPQYYTVNIPYGAEYNVQLADGTKIYLNAGTTLRYPDRFAGNKREIFLSGEAYFEVASDSLHPFIVHTEEVAIRVLGTAFNVNAYPEETWVKTTLERGRVETACGDQHFTMKPGTQVAYNKTTREADYFPVNTRHYTSWREGFYDFEDMPLDELMRIFARWYDVQIQFMQPELKNIKFSGRLKRYDDLNLLFEKLEYTGDVKFYINERRVFIQSK